MLNQIKTGYGDFRTLMRESMELTRSMASRNPGLVLGAVAAPALIRNDQRGYFQSALLTTPLIFAGAAAFPGARNAIKSRAPFFKSFADKAASGIPGFRGAGTISAEQLRNAQANQAVTMRELEAMKARFYAQAVVANPSRTINPIANENQYKGVMGAFEKITSKGNLQRLVADEAKRIGRDLHPEEIAEIERNQMWAASVAAQSEAFHSMGARELATQEFLKTGVTSDVAAQAVRKVLEPDQIRGIISSRKDDYKFLKAMGHHFQAQLHGPAIRGSGMGWTELEANRPHIQIKAFRDLTESERELFKVRHADVWSALQGNHNLKEMKFSYLERKGEAKFLSFELGRKKVYLEHSGAGFGGEFGNLGLSFKKVIDAKGDIHESSVMLARHINLDEDKFIKAASELQYFIGHDPSGGWENLATGGVDVGLGTVQRKFRDMYVAHPNLPIYNGKTWDELEPGEKTAMLQREISEGKVVKVGTEARLPFGGVESPTARLFTPSGQYNPKKASSFFRAHKSDFWFKLEHEHVNNQALAPLFQTTAVQDLLNEERLPEVAMHIGQVPAGIQTSLGSVPTNYQDFLTTQKVWEEKLVQGLMRDGQKQKDAENIARTFFAEHLTVGENLTEAHVTRNLQALSNLQFIGEGAILSRENAHNLKGTGERGIRLTHKGQIVDLPKVGDSFTEGQVLGEIHGQIVRAPFNGRVAGTQLLGDEALIRFNPELAFGTGAKVDFAGVKSQVVGVSNKEMNHAVRLLNKIGDQTGLFHFAQNTEMLSMAEYDLAKRRSGELMEHSMNIAADLVRRTLPTTKDQAEYRGIVNKFASDMRNYGYTVDQEHGRIFYDHKRILGSTEQQLADESQGALRSIDEFMSRSGQYFAGATRPPDSVLAGWAQAYKKVGIDNFQRYYETSTGAATVRLTAHTSLTKQREVRVTWDMIEEMQGQGLHDMAAAVKSRALYDGNPEMTRELYEHLSQRNSITKPFGKTVNLDEAGLANLNNFSRIDELRSMGSVFDPRNELARQNISVMLTKNTKTYYVPFLGHDAAGGKVNRYDNSEFSANARETGFFDVIKKHQTGTDAEFEAALERYNKIMMQTVAGKKGQVLRPEMVDPDSIAGRLMHVGDDNIHIGEAQAAKLFRREELEAFKQGKAEHWGLLQRHPVSGTISGKLVYNPRLGDDYIGVGDKYRILLRADYDGEYGNLMLARGGTKEAKELETIGISRQELMLRMDRALLGKIGNSADNQAEFTSSGLKSLSTKLGDLFSQMNPVEAIQSRMAGSQIGRASNLLTRMQLNLEANELLKNSFEERHMLQRGLFENLRQTLISGMKSKSGATLTAEKAAALADNLERSLNMRHTGVAGGRDLFMNTLQELSQFSKRSANWEQDPEAFLALGLHQNKIANPAEFNPMEEFFKQRRDLMEKAYDGMNLEADRMAEVLTGSERKAVRLQDVINQFRDHLPATQADSRGAYEVSSRLGELNRGLADAADQGKGLYSDLRNVMRESGGKKILGAGIALAALAGLGLSSLGPRRNLNAPGEHGLFHRGSANRYRPEDILAGSDQVPGQAVAGSYSHNPPRGEVYSNPGVQTTLVAPIQRTKQAVVKLESESMSSISERARFLGLHVGTSARVHVDVRDTTNYRSLRMREQIRTQQEKLNP